MQRERKLESMGKLLKSIKDDKGAGGVTLSNSDLAPTSPGPFRNTAV